MILRWLRVEGFRAHAERIEVGPFSERINVLFAPNAAGKSTLFDALVCCMMDRHRVGGELFEQSVRPWGRRLAPSIEVEFRHGGAEYRIDKRFLDEPRSRLFRLEHGRFTPQSEGDAADAKILEVLGAVAAPKGTSQPEHRGLAQVLWAPQGELRLPAPKDGFPDALVDRIRASLGAQLAGPGAERILQKIAKAFAEVYTETGKLKKAAAIHERKRDLDAARAAREAAREAHAQFEGASRKVAELRVEHDQLAGELDVLKQDLQAAGETAKAFAAASIRRKELERSVKDREAVHGDIKELQEARRELERLGRELPVLFGALKDCASREETAQASYDRARPVSGDALAFERERTAAAEAGETLKALREIDGQLDALSKKLRELRAPDRKVLDALRKAFRARDDAATRLEASLITLEVLPEKEIEARIVAGEAPKDGSEGAKDGRRLLPGEPLVVRGSPEVVVDLAGIARVRARGHSGSAEENRAALDRASHQIQELTNGLGSSELVELEALQGESAELEKRIDALKAEVRARLKGRRREDVEAAAKGSHSALERWYERYPAWRESPPDTEKLGGEAELLEKNLESARRDREAARTKESEARGSRDKAQVKALGPENRLQKLVAGPLDDRPLAEFSGENALEWEAARAKLTAVRAELEAFAGDPAERIEQLALRVKKAEDASRSAFAGEKLEEGKLAGLSGRSVYTALAEAEEKQALAEEAHERERIASEAIKLLHDTVEECRTEMQASVAAPVEEAAGAILERITGGRLGSVRLTANLAPERIAVADDSVEAPLEDLSGGEAEQLHLATRLALAEVLAREERPLVVLDDVLTATDAPRLGRALEVIAEAADRLQILILTCHPERYEALRGTEGANFIDLEAVKAEGAARGRSR